MNEAFLSLPGRHKHVQRRRTQLERRAKANIALPSSLYLKDVLFDHEDNLQIARKVGGQKERLKSSQQLLELNEDLVLYHDYAKWMGFVSSRAELSLYYYILHKTHLLQISVYSCVQ